ncbi:unnamed protein product [Amaranthus hypochondriacus]
MASSSSVISLLFPLLSLLFISSVSARPGFHFHPCNTLIVSTYSFSVLPQNPNPNPNIHPQFLIVSSDFHHFRHRRFLPLMVNHHPHLDRKTQVLESLKERPESFYSSFGFSSFKDRTKDILSVVASLLFGAACGALTAGTMYLIWSLFNHRYEGSYRSLDGFTSDDDDDNDDNDIFNPKKKGYVTIPAAPVKNVDSTPFAVPVPAKESA